MLKQGLSLRVVDEYQVDRVFEINELQQLFRFDEDVTDMMALDPQVKHDEDEDWLPREERETQKKEEADKLKRLEAGLNLTMPQELEEKKKKPQNRPR